MIELNINDTVLVKLTDAGKEELLRQSEELRKDFPHIKHEYKLPQEDDDGFSKWQLHSLMNHFGHLMLVETVYLPFETTVRIDRLG